MDQPPNAVSFVFRVQPRNRGNDACRVNRPVLTGTPKI
jgi:hypothetical protein